MVDRRRMRRLASGPVSEQINRPFNRESVGSILDINDEAKGIVHELGSAINEAVENSPQVAEAIERLREAGYEMELTLRLEIGLRPHDEDGENQSDAALELTDEDRRTLRRMKIRIDESE